MIEGINNLLEKNDILVRCNTEWYRLESVSIDDKGEMPIIVSNEDGEEFEFDMADIEEFEPAFEAFSLMDKHIVGEA